MVSPIRANKPAKNPNQFKALYFSTYIKYKIIDIPLQFYDKQVYPFTTPNGLNLTTGFTKSSWLSITSSISL